MSSVRLTKWGNSIGVRIPSVIIKEAHLTAGEELEIIINRKGGLTLMPIKNQQEDWTKAFNAIADANADELLIDLTNDFDDEVWTW